MVSQDWAGVAPLLRSVNCSVKGVNDASKTGAYAPEFRQQMVQLTSPLAKYRLDIVKLICRDIGYFCDLSKALNIFRESLIKFLRGSTNGDKSTSF